MRALTVSALLLLCADAHGNPSTTKANWYRFVDKERHGVVRAEAILDAIKPPQSLKAPPPRNGLDVIHRTMDIDVDPKTGAVTGTVDLRVTSVGVALMQIGASVANGLTITAIEIDGMAATVAELDSNGFRYFAATLPKSIAVATESIVRIAFQGTLSCAGKDQPCTLQPGFARFTTGSIFPYVLDLQNAQSPYDGATTDLTLRVPETLDTIVSAEPVSKKIENGKSITVWNVPKDVNHMYGFYAFVGDLKRMMVQGRSVPTEVIAPKDTSAADAKITQWTPNVLSFVEELAGTKLPFGHQWLVRLPASMDDVGTVSYGMTLLNEIYGNSGDEIYEETWAHENSHLAWAIVVPEPEGHRTRLFTEGLATLSEIEYSKRNFQDEDRDAYLARRYHSIRLDWREKGGLEKLPAVVTTEAIARKLQSSPDHSGWAYEKSAATLDHIRATIGDEAFTKAMHEYVKLYAWTGASVDEFRGVLENASGIALKPLFDRWVTKTSRPELRFGYRAAEGGGWEAVVDKDDEQSIPLALTVIDTTGAKKVVRVVASGTSTAFPLETTAGIHAVIPNPRLGILARLKSQVEGDVDYDGAAEGKDLLACARMVGTEYENATGIGLWNLKTNFAVECDRDDDGDVDDDDWAAIVGAYGGTP